MDTIMCNLKYVCNFEGENTDKILSCLNQICQFNENYEEFNIFLEDGYYIVVEFKLVYKNTYKILYYNNALPLPENTLITFGKNINGILSKTKIVYKQNHILKRKNICECKFVENQVCGRHIVIQKCDQKCKNVSEKTLSVRYFEASLQTIDELYFGKTFQSFVTPVIVSCSCTVLQPNILLLTGNTCYLGIKIGKTFWVYSIYADKLIKCTLRSKKTTHGDMVLICEHSFDKNTERVAVIDSERFLLKDFKL